MYELDMRLRPSGNKGPIAVSLQGFRHYHEWDSWTWERMALTRARVVAGPAAMRQQVNQAIEVAIRRQQEPERIRSNATSMRARMERDLRPHGPWDFKLRAGGLIDIEFIAQVLQLIHASDAGFRRSQTTHIALQRLRDAGVIARPDADLLISAERLWRDDDVYDLVVVLGHNDDPVIPGAGSAIFLHLARPGYSHTEGCVALARDDLEVLLAEAKPGDVLEIKG